MGQRLAEVGAAPGPQQPLLARPAMFLPAWPAHTQSEKQNMNQICRNTVQLLCCARLCTRALAAAGKAAVLTMGDRPTPGTSCAAGRDELYSALSVASGGGETAALGSASAIAVQCAPMDAAGWPLIARVQRLRIA
jgi:hypothetical protein